MCLQEVSFVYPSFGSYEMHVILGGLRDKNYKFRYIYVPTRLNILLVTQHILGRPFLATSNAIINCRNGVMQLTFGNMTLELNFFHLSKKHMQPVEDDCEEVCIIDTILKEQANEQQVQDLLTQELSECLVVSHPDSRSDLNGGSEPSSRHETIY